MAGFLASERRRQAQFKQESPYFSEAARADGVYGTRGRAYPFCLPDGSVNENLFTGIRQSALEFFNAHRIVWHRARHHLCSSQVCCVNFLFPFADHPDALRRLLLPLYPNIKRMLPIEGNWFVTFEYIGADNYLNERGKTRTRGANVTSADAAVMFERDDGKRQIVLIEWKYTESYAFGNSKTVAASGTDRTQIYRALYDRDDCPLNKTLIRDFSALFYEPFYQLMRQQFLAHEMEKVHELDADVVSVLHISPAHNQAFKRVTSPELKKQFPNETALGVWKRLVKPETRFMSVGTESLFRQFPANEYTDFREWAAYMGARYVWLKSIL